MAFSSVLLLQWWEEWQLRVLVLSSLAIQLFLLARQVQSKFLFPAWFKACIRLVYIASEPVTINALATLLNRQKKQSAHDSVHGSRELELLWAPILLMHLGGLNIPCYNIQDNEQWGHHVMVAVTQVSVALYVFWSWWPASANKMLSAAAILVFIPGILKCIVKPWAARSARFSSLQVEAGPLDNPENGLEAYLYCVRAFVLQGEEGRDMFRRTWNVAKERLMVGMNQKLDVLEELQDVVMRRRPELVDPQKLETMCRMLFADHICSYGRRLENLVSFWASDAKTMHSSLSSALFNIYSSIYAKRDKSYLPLWILKVALPIPAICLFHSNQQAYYSRQDLRVTLVLLYGTLVLELTSGLIDMWSWKSSWPDIFPQHNVLGFLASSRRRPVLTRTAELLRSRDLLYQQWSPKPCRSSQHITELVCQYIRFGWNIYIVDVDRYRAFIDMKGNLTLMCNRWAWVALFGMHFERPFEEKILIWHIATDLCFHLRSTSSSENVCARQSREISNYMMHMLVANPDMLMVGIRKDLVTTVYDEIHRFCRLEAAPPDERGLARHMFESTGHYREPLIIQRAVDVARALMKQDHTEEQMWVVILGVWVEMLCFSAGTGRGYLHAKSLGAGVEYISYVWLLLSYAGMETLPERLQRNEPIPALKIGGEIYHMPPPCQDTGPVTEEENPAFPSTTRDTDHVKQENAVDSSTSQHEGNGSEIEVAVSSYIGT